MQGCMVPPSRTTLQRNINR